MMRAHHRLSYLWAALAWLPVIAHAHLVTTGLGQVYDGISHFALSPEEVFPVAALALLAGLRGPAPARDVLFMLPTTWLLGGLAAAFGLSLPDLSGQIVTAALFLLVGGMGVLEAFEIGKALPRPLRVPRIAIALTAVFLGLIRGNVDMTGFLAASPTTISAGVVPLLGVVLAVFLLTALAASVSLPLKAMWARMAVCVTGSWSAALGLLLVGWSIHLSMIAR